MPKASFLLRPRWILSHLLVAGLVVVMVNLGFWQLDRLEQRRERNDTVSAREEQPVVAVEELLGTGDGEDAVDRARFRTVSATGTYDQASSVLVRNRTQDGLPGVWAVTPLVLDSGESVGVVRGFAGLGSDGEAGIPDPPSGEITVTGAVADPGAFDGTAPQDISPLVDRAEVLPAVIMAEESLPPEEGSTLQPVAPPEEGEGPHLSYAVQWFIFSTIAVVGYPLVLRRVVQRRTSEPAGDLEREMKGRADGQHDDVDRELDEILRHG